MNANKRVITRPQHERVDMTEGESYQFWLYILGEYSMRDIRDQSIQLMDNNPVQAIYDREDQS